MGDYFVRTFRVRRSAPNPVRKGKKDETMTQQLALPEIPAPPRPTSLSAEEKLAVCRELIDDLIKSSALDDMPEVDRDIAAKQLAKEAGRNMDGYQIMRALDRYHSWEGSPDLVEGLDGFSADYDHKLSQKVAAWVEEHKIMPVLTAGTKVECVWGGETHRGTIRDVNTSKHFPGSYSIVREGDDVTPEASAMIVRWEDAKPLEEGA